MIKMPLVLCIVFACVLNAVLAQTNKGLTAYVGKEGLLNGKEVRDTMTRQQFLDYGIVQLSDNRFTVSSFTIAFSSCDNSGPVNDIAFYDILGNSFKTNEVTSSLNQGKHCLLVIIDNIKFLNFKKQVIDARGSVVITLIG